MRVSIDDVTSWYNAGWISFDVRDEWGLDEGRIAEICFVRNIARSGLGDIHITQFLDELPRPYVYHPNRTAYSFAYGWVQIPQR